MGLTGPRQGGTSRVKDSEAVAEKKIREITSNIPQSALKIELMQ